MLYYTTIFCSIYNKSAIGWINDTAIAMLMDYFFVTPVICIIKTVVKLLLRVHPYFKVLLIVDYLFFFLNFCL